MADWLATLTPAQFGVVLLMVALAPFAFVAIGWALGAIFLPDEEARR